MARPLVIGNGSLLLCLDDRLVVRDLYYPRVGELNHIVGNRNQLGFWVDGAFSWLGDDAGWDRKAAYRPGSLVTDCKAVHRGLGLKLTLQDAVHHRKNIFIRHLHLTNLREQPREVRVFATFDYDVDGTDIGDTAFWDPSQSVMVHYKRDRWFLMGARGPGGGVHQFATGRKRFQGAEGTWRDAEDGVLEGHPISQGAVDSSVSLLVPLGPGEEADVYLWTACATDHKYARHLHSKVLETGPGEMIAEVDGYWRSWIEGRYDLEPLPKPLQEAFQRSVLIVRTQVDNGGAIVAATDTEIMAYNRDHYSYVWPRDGAFIAAALDRAGYRGVTRPFYEFCQKTISEDGFFWHKYNPDGTLGSSWHPLLGAGGAQLPIQEDETALVLWALGRHYRTSRDQEFIGDLYSDLIHPAANFLWRFRDEKTRLPLESYDLWEERRGIFTFTTASVVAGLTEASHMARGVGDSRRAERYANAAAETREAMLKYLWSEERQCFLRGLYVRADGELVPDATLESSVMAVFLLGVLPATDPMVEATVRKLETGLWSNTMVGGMARYYNDYYFRVSDNPEVSPGNPWIICTLWLARWYAAVARNQAELKPALDLVQWAVGHALPSGALPEQVNPFTGAPLSVTPLTWSHATLMDTLLDLSERMRVLPQT